MALEVDMKDLADLFEIEIKLKNLNQWRFRVWIGTKIIQLGVWIIWANVRFVEDEVQE